MPDSFADSSVPRHLDRLEIGPLVRAKADLKKQEIPWNELVGRAMQRCFSLAGVSQKEAAALVNRDAAQVGRWVAGSERPQLDTIFAVEILRGPLVIALAELASMGVRVTTHIEIDHDRKRA